MIKGYEADDVIGSMAKRAEKEGFTVYMVTPDKDYGQLISPSIIQYKPGKAGSEHELIDTGKVCEKYNISTPEQVIEILTIMGDSSDNVPGVKGVGEVGAGKLISKYGSVANIYDHIDELTPKQKEAFENARPHIDLSHTLVTIKTDIPLDVTTEEMDLSTGYSTEAADLFEEYEFGSLRKHLGDIKPSVPKTERKISTNMCSAAELIQKVLANGSCAILIDEDNATIATKETGDLSCSAAQGKINEFKDLLMNPGIEKYGYDLKLLKNQLVKMGLDLNGKLMDIELMHYLIDPEKSHKLEILSRIYLDVNL
jgi:DNA polymerase-1